MEVRSVETTEIIEKAESTTQHTEEVVVQPTTDNRQPTTENVEPTTQNLQPTTPVIPNSVSGQPKVSALSLASIRAKKEMAEAQKSVVKDTVHLPSEPFTETEMLEQWLKYAQRMEDKGYRIVASLLTINDPILDGTTIIHELPNESSKIDFEKERPELLGYLRGKLHNHDIQINVKVNETLVVKKAFTNQDKYNRLVEINPNLELLKKMFDLDV
ncbi:DNA polymerase III subunit gamma/tau [Flavobacterium sp. J49]|uniref:DNA polymerase III subunit gamma/tau n=1 Tax=Flavobacterium sp. J49 TaxID=2718534 RepID=UPI001E5E9FFC|nr:DNA polymerase III subunit gamma/tau [Flavobacterium sp. J49]